jgi:serine protease Do
MRKRLLLLITMISLAASQLIYDAPALAQEREKRADVRRNWSRSRYDSATRVGKNHDLVKQAFRGSIKDANEATARFYQDNKDNKLVALGTIVDPNGYVLTKASEIDGEIICRVAGGKQYPATIVGIDEACDLAMYKIDAKGLHAAKFAQSTPKIGAWLAATGGINSDPVAIGVVSVAPREIEQESGVLGIFIDNSPAGPVVRRVIANTGAEKASIAVDDVVTELDGDSLESSEDLTDRIRKKRPGTRVRLKIVRDGNDLNIFAVLGRADTLMSEDMAFQEDVTGPLSQRRSGFPLAIQHDCVLRPNQCGGPLVDLDGNIVGINIARADRVSSLALTAGVVQQRIEEMKLGRLANK